MKRSSPNGQQITFPRIAGLLCAALGLFDLSGWALGISWMKSVLPGAVEMKPNTAVGLVLAGMALCLLDTPVPRCRQIGKFLALAVAVLGLATLAEYLFGWKIGIDEFLFRDTVKAYNPVPGRMSPYSAVVLSAIGAGLTALAMRWPRWLVWVTATLTLLIGGVSVVGYLWKAHELVTDSFLPPVAVNSAAAFILLGVGLLMADRDPAGRTWPELKSLSPVETKTLAGFLAALSLLLVVGGYTYRAAVEAANSAQWVAHTHEVRVSLRRLYSAISDAESQQRNYLLTGNRESRENYRRLAVEAAQRLEALTQLVADNPAQVTKLKELQVVIGERMASLARTTDLLEQSGLAAARDQIASGEGVAQMAAIRVLIERLDSAEEKLLAARKKDSARGTVRTLLSLLLTISFAVAGLVALFSGVRREMATRARSEGMLLDFKAALDEHAIVAITDAGGKIIYVNDKFCAISKYSREELLGQDHRIVNSGHHPKAFIRELWQTITSGRVWHGEIKNIAKDGAFYWVDTTIVPFLGPAGKPVQYIAIRTDITRQKNAEGQIAQLNTALRERAAELEEANKELESFSYSVSHDLRAPLRHVMGYGEMLGRAASGQLSDLAQRYLKTIMDASVEMGQLIDDLLAFSRIGRIDMREVRVSLDEMVRNVVRGLEMEAKGRNINWKIGPLPEVLGDRATLKQVLANLIGNALKYSRKRPVAEIEIGCAGEEDGRTIFFVRDNGAGFDMKYAHKLFGVFQRLHRVEDFEGTGIGLATVRRIIARHGGRTWAEAALDRGATFYFTLKPAITVNNEIKSHA